MSAKFLRGFAYAGLAALITVASCDAAVDLPEMRFPALPAMETLER